MTLSLVLADTHIHPTPFKKLQHLLHVCVAVVVWEQDLGPDNTGSSGQLFRGHGVGLVAWQESHINAGREFLHFGNVLSVTCNVYDKSVNGYQIAVVPAFWMEILAAFRTVVCGHGLHCHTIANLTYVTHIHSFTSSQFLQAGSVGNNLRTFLSQLLNCIRVKIIAMFMGYQYDIGLGQDAVVCNGLRSLANRIDIQPFAGSVEF